MSPHFIIPLLSIFLMTCVAAAPSTELADEWFVPLQNDAAYALVDKESGQVRIHAYTGGKIVELGTYRSGLPHVTGLTTDPGFNGESDDEFLVLSSSITNRALVSDSFFLNIKPLDFKGIGPDSPFPLRQNVESPFYLGLNTLYAQDGQFINLYQDLTSDSVNLENTETAFPEFQCIQPFPIPAVSFIHAAGLAPVEENTNLHLVQLEGTTPSVSKAFEIEPADRLATYVIGEGDLNIIIAYQTGSDSSSIIIIGEDGTPEEITPAMTPFPVSSITAVKNVPNAPSGVLLTSADGSTSAYAVIVDGKSYKVIQTFTPSTSSLTGLLPVPGAGFIAMECNGGAGSDAYTLYGFSFGSWIPLTSGSFSPLLAPSTTFATLFWFDSVPLVNPTAELLKLETRPDWTRKPVNAPIPANLLEEDFVSSTTGLSNPTPFVPSPPTGASYVMANQYLDSVSVSALDTNSAIQTPGLLINPASGTYLEPVSVVAIFDEDTSEAFLRENKPGSPWLAFTETLSLAYPSDWLFYARDLTTNATSPVISRNYDFPVDLLNTIDSDGDGVPDYVERELGLALDNVDTDGDLRPDLEELLEGTDPLDENDPPAQNLNDPIPSRNPVFVGEGFQLAVQAFDPNGVGATPALTVPVGDPLVLGAKIDLFDMRGNLLSSNNVQDITTGPLSGQDGAILNVTNPLDAREWVIASSPLYFDTGTTIPTDSNRTGREIFSVFQRPTITKPNIAFTPSGSNRAADAADWITAAQTAYASFQPITALTEIRPINTAAAALAEAAIYDILASLTQPVRESLGLVAADPLELGTPNPTVGTQFFSRSNFSLFSGRDTESYRVSFTQEMADALVAEGWDLAALINLITPVTSNISVQNLTTAIYNRHIALTDGSNVIPDVQLVPLPLNVFRSIIANGSIIDPTPGDLVRDNPYAPITAGQITPVKTLFDSVLASLTSTKRPISTWTLTIEPPTTPGHNYDYRRAIAPNNLAWLVDRFGDRVQLEQGLGLQTGIEFMVQGYIDVNGPAGFDTMEVTSVISASEILASDTDTNANLLDDEWELFFFAELGAVSPFDAQPTSGHSYLQYHLSGADPRAGNLTGDIINFQPSNMDIIYISADNAYEISFDFPSEFFDDFVFTLNSSNTLSGFGNLAQQAPATSIGTNRYAFLTTMAEASLDKNFFRITMAIKAP